MSWQIFIAEKRLRGQLQAILANKLMRLCHKQLFRLPPSIVGWAFMPTRFIRLKKTARKRVGSKCPPYLT